MLPSTSTSSLIPGSTIASLPDGHISHFLFAFVLSAMSSHSNLSHELLTADDLRAELCDLATLIAEHHQELQLHQTQTFMTSSENLALINAQVAHLRNLILALILVRMLMS